MQEAIAGGEVTLAFGRWTRPTVWAGGTLRTSVGLPAIEAVEPVDEAAITADEARRAGFGSREELMAFLARRPDGRVDRIALRPGGPDPRVALRERADLAAAAGLERDRLTADVRRLTELGLTEHLRVGYRLSPRGAGVLARLDARER